MQLEFLGAAHEVTGSCHYLEIGGKHFLIDCGMEQGPDIYENQKLPVNAAAIDYVFVTHAHIDHSGLLPLLWAQGFRGKIYATHATTQLCTIMLKDSAHIQEYEAEWKNRRGRRAGRKDVAPMYSMEAAEEVLKYFIPCHYNEKISITDEVTIQFRDVGHLLGSSFIEIWAQEKGGEEIKIIFSGDIGNGRHALIRDPEIPDQADYLIMESTYGDRNHNAPPDYAVELAKVLERTFSRGGNVVIPAFSVGRTQEILYFIRQIKSKGMLPSFKGFEVYVDSPLAIEATGIYNANERECFREEVLDMIDRGENPIDFPGLKKSVTSEESIAINFLKKPVVIISASGMCEAGRIRHHLKHNLWRPESSIVFVGYQVPGTLGNLLLGGAEAVKLFGETIRVKAEIINLPGISGHADKDHLIAWVTGIQKIAKRIFIVHGEDQVCDQFAAVVENLTGTETTAPYSGDIYDLDKNECMVHGSRKLAEKRKEVKQTQTAFERLVASGERLATVISKNKGLSNKDLIKFMEQINMVSNKWDHHSGE